MIGAVVNLLFDGLIAAFGAVVKRVASLWEPRPYMCDACALCEAKGVCSNPCSCSRGVNQFGDSGYPVQELPDDLWAAEAGRGGGNAVGEDAEPSSGIRAELSPAGPTNPVFADPLPCEHCGRVRPSAEFARIWNNGYDGLYLCHPDEGLNCYELVSVWKEPVGFRIDNRSAPLPYSRKIPFDGLFPSGQPSVIPASVCLYCFGPVTDCCHSGESIPDDQPLGEAAPPGLAVNPVYAEIQDEFHRNQQM